MQEDQPVVPHAPAEPSAPASRPKVFGTVAMMFREGTRMVRAAGLPLLAVVVLYSLIMLLVFSPLIGWLFREALRANGMMALDLGSFAIGAGLPVTIGLIVLIVVLAFLALTLKFGLVILLLDRARRGAPLFGRSLVSDLFRMLRKTLRPSAIPLLLYLFLLLPLTGFGFASVMTQRISIPTFISAELMKGTTTAVVWVIGCILFAFLSVRFALTVPLFALTTLRGDRSLRASWRLTRGRTMVSVVIAVLLTVFVAGIVSLLLLLAGLAPTAIADATAPTAAPTVAAFSLAIVSIAAAVLSALVTTMIAALLVALTFHRRADLPTGTAFEVTPDAKPSSSAAQRRVFLGVTGVAVIAIAVITGTTGIHSMEQLSSHPSTLVIGHRGFSDGGVENTIGGLEAAARIGTDVVEIDVMQAKDGGFVIMHDANLSRLTGQDLQVKDLTVEELTALTVSDLQGHQDRIPDLATFMKRAQALEQTLLIEIKLGGADTEDFVDLLVAELDELGVLHDHLFHTLDHASAERLKRIQPDLTVGYILAVAGVGVPETSADFLVVEEWTATPTMQARTEEAGLAFLSWTVNDESSLRELMRRDIAGVITDHPDRALEIREEMSEEEGLAPILFDVLTRFVLPF